MNPTLALKRLNRLRKDDSALSQNWKAIEDTFSFLLKKKLWTSDRITYSTISQSFEEAGSLMVSPSSNALIVGLIIDSPNKTAITGNVDGISASTTGGVSSVIEILRAGTSFARYQVDPSAELPSFFCLDSSPLNVDFKYSLQVRNTGAGTALTITNMRIFALELF